MRAVVLLSGGLDSAVCLALAASEDRDIWALTFDYGQRNRRELECARSLAAKYRARHRVIAFDLGFGAGIVGDAVIETGRSPDAIGAKGDRPASYVPARNTIFLAHALSIAESVAAREIWIGANAGDREGYPDCRGRFFKAFMFAAALGTRIEDLEIRHPLLIHSKRGVMQLARMHGIDPAETSSCYEGTDCGKCDACVLRLHASGVHPS